MLRKWLGARALLWHLLVVVIVTGCLVAGWWQVHRAMAGNALSYAYSVEWPVFAVVAVIGWWQLIHEDPSEVVARKEERRRRGRPNPVAYDLEILRQEIAAHPDLVAAFPELSSAFPELAAGGDAGGGSSASRSDLATRGAETVGADAGGVGAGDVGAGGGGAAPSEELRSYNDALARLAATGKAKSWRNPHGR